MARVLVLTSDLPFFPGRNGHDFFNLRHLGRRHVVGVVAPCYEHLHAEGVANLEASIDKTYFWPRPVGSLPQSIPFDINVQLKAWVKKIPKSILKSLLFRAIGLDKSLPDGFFQLSVVSNCAPYLLRAIWDLEWSCIVLIQSSSAVWLNYIPVLPAKLTYLHDVRSDYLRKTQFLSKKERVSARGIRALVNQEKRIAALSEATGFVSDLDLQRGRAFMTFGGESGVAPIPVDTEYFVEAPKDWRADKRPIVLFTGHLSHPPNVDAVTFFVTEIWPKVKSRVSDAIFQIVGMTPSRSLVELVVDDESVELYADVPDIRPFFWNTNLYVIPMRYGGGVRQKIFEAWAMKVPVVCTTMAVEGTLAQDGENCWLADDPGVFAELVCRALSACEEITVVTGNAFESVRKSNSIEAAAPRFESLVERAINIKRNRPYRALLDLRWMEIGKAGGAEQMAYELVSAISKVDRKNHFRILCPRNTYFEWNFPKRFQCKGKFVDQPYREFECYRAAGVNDLCRELGIKAVLNPSMRSLARFRKLDFDFVHSLNSHVHPDLEPFPSVLTVHDLQHLHFPEFFEKDEWQVREDLYRKSTANAKHIICISDFVKKDLHAKYGVPWDKMTSIWNIPSRNVWSRIDLRKRHKVLKQLRVNGPYFLYPAHCWPHKNHSRLIEAFAMIAQDLPINFKLILTGNQFRANHPARLKIEELNLQSRVSHLGYRSPLEMRCLFQGASALVFPSLFEGFGIPVAEAIISGIPVACSNVTSLPEVAGDAALTFDPFSVEDIALNLLRVATDYDLRKVLVERAKIRRTRFSSQRIAVRTLAVYREVFEGMFEN